MKYIDISHTIYSGMKKYPSDPPVKVSLCKSLNNGNSCNLCTISCGSHSGTHVDAPRHVFKKKKTVDKIKIKDLMCDVAVVDIKQLLKKSFEIKIQKNKNIKGILLKSARNKNGLTIREAKMLLRQRINLVGTEEMSIEESKDSSHPVHRLLLKNGIIIVESLNLKKVKQGFYKLICLPLKIKKGDGAPCRAILTHD